MERVNLTTKLGKLTLENPIMTASGTFGYADEFEVFTNVGNIGAIVTKAITLEPRKGNEGNRLYETANGLINRIGLENVGIDAFIEEKLPKLKEKDIKFVLNVAGSSVEEYIQVAKKADEAGIQAIEINVSCPNVKSGCLEFGTNASFLYDLISKIRVNYKNVLIVKLTPNVSDIEALAKASKDAGADCLSAINTLKGLGVSINFANGEFSKTFIQGGLSGKCIKPVALSMVKRIKEAVDIPIIGIGGISTLNDVFEFFAAGAEAVQIGTENFINPDVTGILIQELSDFVVQNGFRDLNHLKEELRK